MTHKYLDAQRSANAQAAWEAHIFPAGSEPEEASGWEHVSGEDVWSRPVYFRNTEDPDGPSVAGHYTVKFEKNSSEISGSYASIAGNDIGTSVPVRAYVIDPEAPKLPADYERLAHQDVVDILPGLQEITWIDQDNDAERWSLTAAGQFLRQTTKTLERYYVVPAEDALREIGDIDPDALEPLRAAGAFDGIAASATP